MSRRVSLTQGCLHTCQEEKRDDGVRQQSCSIKVDSSIISKRKTNDNDPLSSRSRLQYHLSSRNVGNSPDLYLGVVSPTGKEKSLQHEGDDQNSVDYKGILHTPRRKFCRVREKGSRR